MKYLLVDLDYAEVIGKSTDRSKLEKRIEELIDGNYREEDRYIIVTE